MSFFGIYMCRILHTHILAYAILVHYSHTHTHKRSPRTGIWEKNTEKAEALKPKAGNKNSAFTWRNKQVFSLSAKHGVAVI